MAMMRQQAKNPGPRRSLIRVVISPMPMVFALIWAVVPVSAQGQQAQAVTQEDVDALPPAELVLHGYRHLISGCKNDAERNHRGAAFYTKKAEDNSSPEYKKQFLKLAETYEKMAVINETVLTAFDNGTIAPAREALLGLPELERTVQEITRKPVEREWLTFQEVDAYYKRLGSAFKTEAPRVLPFHRKHWDQNAIKEMQKTPEKGK